MIVDRWREVPAIPSNGFPGMMELSKGGRYWQVRAVGPEARSTLVLHVEAQLAREAPSIVVGDDRVGLIDQSLDRSDRRVVCEPEKVSALAGRRLLDPKLAVRDTDHRATGRAVDLGQDVIEIGASHRAMIADRVDSGQRS